jgi:hypothetical protein
MAERRIYIDVGPGETRGVITLDGRPERLLIERAGLDWPRLGERHRARCVRIDKGLGLALLDLGQGAQAALRLKPDRSPPTEGQLLEVEISIEPQGAKAAVARVLEPASGAPGRMTGTVDVEARMRALAPEADVDRGADARAAADDAEDAALAIEHPLAGGGSVAIETTRALTAVDVDLGQGGNRDPKRAARQANLNAIGAVARLLRLKALGGLVVIDLVGRGHDGPALARAVQTAFTPDQPGVIVGPVTKFGTLELALPRRLRPLADILLGPDGRLSAQTLALRLLRDAENAARADPGARLTIRTAPEVFAAAMPVLPLLTGTVGGRLTLAPDPAMDRQTWDISSL